MISCFDSDISTDDKERVLETLSSKILAFGPNVSKFEDRYSSFSNKEYNVGFNSASSAAYLLYQYLYESLGPCRVYTPSLGFVSPVFAAMKNNHEVVFTDVDENLLMSVESLKNSIIKDDKPNIVMPVLYGGVSDIPGLESFCQENSCIIILDSAHCISPLMKHDYAFYSFHPVKPVCMSNGGLLSTDCPAAAKYMFSGRNFGRKVIGDSYDLSQSGFNFYMNNLNASLGLSQLDRCQSNAQKRKNNFTFLQNNIPKEVGYLAVHDASSSYYLSSLILNKGFSSVIMREELLKRGIQTSFHYPFLHETTYYRQSINLPVLDSLKDRIINLPIHQNLSLEDMEKISHECIRHSRSRRQSQ
tara:strand:+ start:10889 stop:11965 length:1077 start_codon:yes stop_codon:yes gene_type:complete